MLPVVERKVKVGINDKIKVKIEVKIYMKDE